MYDEYYDCVLCPQKSNIKIFHNKSRRGYKEFKSKGYICGNCPNLSKCTNNAKCEKTVVKHILDEYLDMEEEIRCTFEYEALYEKRKETIERGCLPTQKKNTLCDIHFIGA